ncbi:MAG: hypothetical protein NT116_04000, partial [Candidatus Parcubacteria bacterium]|nr:hypothetical protein [Candidatus Parcubacteria bacterium]
FQQIDARDLAGVNEINKNALAAITFFDSRFTMAGIDLYDYHTKNADYLVYAMAKVALLAYMQFKKSINSLKDSIEKKDQDKIKQETEFLAQFFKQYEEYLEKCENFALTESHLILRYTDNPSPEVKKELKNKNFRILLTELKEEFKKTLGTAEDYEAAA